MTYKIFISALTLIMLPFTVFSQNDKDKVYNQLLEKYGDLSSISLKYRSMDNRNIEGAIEAKRGNKYIIKMGNRIITCNGMSIWNYSIDDKNVIISKFDSDLHSNSIEKMFFSLLEEFIPSEMKKESSTRGTTFTILTLDGPKGSKFDVQKINLWLNRNMEIESFSLFRSGIEEKWAIWDIALNKKIANKTFDFIVPKGTEVIDLR